jgi:hypothetical protein
MLSPEQILELYYWAPLVALLLSSLGILALKRASRLPLWLRRILAPPFYFVSLPIATLVVGAEMLTMTAAKIYQFGALAYLLGIPILILFGFPYGPAESFVLANLWGAPFAVSFVSGYTMWRMVGRGSGPERPPGQVRQQLRALIHVLVFAWAFLTLRYEILLIAARPVWHLRIF